MPPQSRFSDYSLNKHWNPWLDLWTGPSGFMNDIPLSTVFHPKDAVDCPPVSELTTHFTNWKSAEDHADITIALLQEELAQNWIFPFSGTLEEAKARWPKGVGLGKLGLAFSDSRKPRLVLDNTVCGTNSACAIPEKQNMPSASDMVRCFPLRNTVKPQSAFSLDIEAAHKRIRVKEDEVGLIGFTWKGQICFYRVCPLPTLVGAAGELPAQVLPPSSVPFSCHVALCR